MPRSEKDAFDWSLTFSPEDDYKSIPEWFDKLCDSKFVTACFAITERHTEEDKWHIHIAFRIRRSYKSDYKWWTKYTEDKSPELEIHYHDNLAGLAGGYLAKSEQENVIILRRFGFTDEGLSLGREFYEKGLMRKRIRDFSEAHVGVHPNKWNVIIGAILAETGCEEEDADEVAAQLGIASTACKASIEVYRSMYFRRQRAKEL